MSRLPSVCLPGLDPYLACSPRSRHGVKSSRDLVLPTQTPLGPEPTHQLKKKKRKESNRQGRGRNNSRHYIHTRTRTHMFSQIGGWCVQLELGGDNSQLRKAVVKNMSKLGPMFRKNSLALLYHVLFVRCPITN